MTKRRTLGMLVVALAAMFLVATPASASLTSGAPTVRQKQTLNVGSPSRVALTQRSLLSTIRRIATCAVHIGGFVLGNAVAISKLRKAGGVWKVARRTWNAKGRAGKLKVLSSVFGEIIGLNTVAEACGA